MKKAKRCSTNEKRKGGQEKERRGLHPYSTFRICGRIVGDNDIMIHAKSIFDALVLINNKKRRRNNKGE